MKDILTKGTAEGVRIYALCTTNLVQEAATRHHTSHLASAALGRAMNGALLLAATMKDNERITLRLKGDGPIGEVVADAEGTNVRGYVGDPDVFLPLKNGKLDVGGALGAGNIIVTRYLQNAEPFTGYAELVDGEIASDLTNYLYTSEQTPSSVALGVLVNKEGQVIASGGYFIQAMPGCAEGDAGKTGRKYQFNALCYTAAGAGLYSRKDDRNDCPRSGGNDPGERGAELQMPLQQRKDSGCAGDFGAGRSYCHERG